MTGPAALAVAHLRLRLLPLHRALRAAVERQAEAAARLTRPDVAALCITDDQVKALLGDVDALVTTGKLPAQPAALLPREEVLQENFRARAAEAGLTLPLDRLGLTAFEEEAVLLCAAPELDRAYERIYAYVLDDLNRRFPCVELLCALTAPSLDERLARRRALGNLGRLRRGGLLVPCGEAPTELRQELRLGPGVLDFLLGGDTGALFRDPAEVDLAGRPALPPHVDVALLDRLSLAVREGRLGAVGIWGPPQAGPDEAARALAVAAGRPLRRLALPDPRQAGADAGARLREAVRTAAALGALLWVTTEPLTEAGGEVLGDELADLLAGSPVCVCLTGSHPWRPTALLAARAYAEVELPAAGYEARRAMWSQALPEVGGDQHDALAARYRLSGLEVRAVARVARAQASLASNGHPAPVGDRLDEACGVVVRRGGQQFTMVVRPRRGPDDLILPPELHRQVLEVARFSRAWPRVAEGWGFGRLATGEGGIKALFTGDPGTGKTLAAEVIAGTLGVPLLNVDLARIVSKWVGETEKHLDTAFREAEESHAALFIDEADALFGKRGEIRHGTDRYANLEVSYLLQRLEEHYGLVMLASNLRENIDAAFTRRFQVVLHFPRPAEAERRRIWEIAFPTGAPVGARVDRDALARLDLTGAGIVGAARTAALLAADEGSAAITMAHVVRAVVRQFRREARVLTAADLGPYASLAQEVR
jgi:MoxR-like ATPase